uniref:Integrase catalytic domain-containing protein n=1 Tax=Haemonchus contortus TaxID=6289 RepID=A0A7I5EC00_HAECO
MTARLSTEATTLYRESKKIFRDMKMNLREFISNDANVKRQIAPNDLSNQSSQKILGILWDSSEDTLNLTCSYPPKRKISKRSVSEQVASVYDPLGWLTPITLRGKRFLQQLWKCEYSWDEPLEEKHQKEWKEIIHAFNGFHLKIQRRVTQLNERVKLVMLSDASNNGMAACAYIASNSESHLVVGKSKLPSIRENPTIPKLELNALTMATRLAYTSYEAMKERLTIQEVIILSDSEIALSWIASNPIDQSVGVLVKNRVREIRKIASTIHAPVRFGYVSTAANPADCATRGVTKKEFEGHIWWKGPPYISQPTESWPKDSRLFSLPPDCHDEVACVLHTETDDIRELLDLKRHSNLPRCQRVVAYVLRFIKQLLNNVNASLRSKVENRVPELHSAARLPYITAIEREMALRVLVRNHQKVHLPPKRQVALKQLRLEEDDQGILRCHGRLGNSKLPFDTKHPWIIASKSDLARLIVQHAHLPLHCGTAHTMANVREKFWILKLRQLARSILARCVPCQKMNSLPYRYPEMDDLPAYRVQRTRPFEHTGIDYFGPLSIKKDEDVTKVYGIILTCAVTRLVHLELVPDLSTTHLLLALRRFCARRGVPASITSDNATNFVLGEEILSSTVFPVTNDISFAQSMAEKGIVWKTNTPYAPWQGAIYERLIKSIKHSLYKVMQRTVPTQEVLETLLVEIEGTINSRPLTYQEEKWDDTPILRPIDFIQRDLVIGYPFETIGDEGADDEYHPSEKAVVLKTRRQAEDALRKSHQLTERFWTIWSQQYLTGLRDSHKLRIDNKRSSPKSPEVGHVVLIAEAVLPRNSWRIGRITKINYSPKGVVREAELRMPNGRTIRRPVNLLVPLEIGDSNQSPDESAMVPDSEDCREDSAENRELEKTRYNLRSSRRKLQLSCSDGSPTTT